MLYVIGLSRTNFVKVDLSWQEYLDSNHILSFTFAGAHILYDIAGSRATIYNNKSDAFKILKHLKKNRDKVVIESDIDLMLGDENNPTVSVDDLKVYSLTANLVSR